MRIVKYFQSNIMSCYYKAWIIERDLSCEPEGVFCNWKFFAEQFGNNFKTLHAFFISFIYELRHRCLFSMFLPLLRTLLLYHDDNISHDSAPQFWFRVLSRCRNPSQLSQESTNILICVSNEINRYAACWPRLNGMIDKIVSCPTIRASKSFELIACTCLLIKWVEWISCENDKLLYLV